MNQQLNSIAVIAVAIAIIVLVIYYYMSQPTGFRTLSSRDIGGYDLAGMPINGMTQDQCAKICLDNRDCDMYSYRASDKKCWLKTPKHAAGFFFGMKK
jgi:hypothetical protein